MGLSKFDWISVNLGLIIVDIQSKMKKKIGVPFGTDLGTACLQRQHFNT